MLAEDRTGTNKDDIASVKAANIAMETKLETLTCKVEELENHSRRNSIRLVGLLGIHSFPEPTVIERAHRVRRFHDADSTVNPVRPREVIIKFLNFADKVRVLRIARQKGSILYEGKRVMFFADFSVELRRQRRLFDPVKKTAVNLSHPGSL